MPGARDMRLQADYQHLLAMAKASGGTITIESAQGRPPDRYVIDFACRGIERLQNDKPIYRSLHRVEIKLPARYPAPSAAPVVNILTPIFHPHVFPNNVVCIGSWATTEYLEEFVLRLGALLQFDRRYLNVKDPANEQAMAWVSRNLLLLPTDTQTFQVTDTESTEPQSASLSVPISSSLSMPPQSQPYLLIESTDPEATTVAYPGSMPDVITWSSPSVSNKSVFNTKSSAETSIHSPATQMTASQIEAKKEALEKSKEEAKESAEQASGYFEEDEERLWHSWHDLEPD